MKKINEQELKIIFQKIKNNDEKGIEELYNKYHELVFGICFSILKNRENSEDVVQDLFTKIMKLEKDKLPIKGEASWLYLVTKNEALMFIRRQKQNVDIDDLYSLESESDEIDDIVDMDSYYKLLEGLKPIDKEIISLKVLSDFTFDKISQMLNIPIGTVQWRYYKALHSIKLSLSNLAAFILVFAIWLKEKDNKKFMVSEIEKEQEDSFSESVLEDTVIESEIKGNINKDTASEGFKSEFMATDSSNATKVKSNFDIIIRGLLIIFFVLTIFFSLKRKIKLKKPNKI